MVNLIYGESLLSVDDLEKELSRRYESPTATDFFEVIPNEIELNRAPSEAEINQLIDFIQKPCRKCIFKLKFKLVTEANPLNKNNTLDELHNRLQCAIQFVELRHFAKSKLDRAAPNISQAKKNLLNKIVKTPKTQILHSINLQTDNNEFDSTLDSLNHTVLSNETDDTNNINVYLNEFTKAGLDNLKNQLVAIGIDKIHSVALDKIINNKHAFTSGMVMSPSFMPKGFYISKQKALCYQDNPKHLPSALVPVLDLVKRIIIRPNYNHYLTYLPKNNTLTEAHFKQFNEKICNKKINKDDLISFLKATETQNINNIQTKLDLIGSESLYLSIANAHLIGGDRLSLYFITLITTFNDKKINLDFITQSDFVLDLATIKNMQKLSELSFDQRDWWNSLVAQHIKVKNNIFDFNSFFTAFKDGFLVKMHELNLQTLPTPCPIGNSVHMITSLQRVVDVLTNAKNQGEKTLFEQLTKLSELDWGINGVHYAINHKGYKFVEKSMYLNNIDDNNNDKAEIYFYRQAGINWNKDTSIELLKDINSEAKKKFNPLNYESFLKAIGSSFNSTKDSSVTNIGQINGLINSILEFKELERDELIKQLGQNIEFKPHPLSVSQLQEIVSLLHDLYNKNKDRSSEENKKQIIDPIFGFLKFECIDVFYKIHSQSIKLKSNILSLPIALIKARKDLNTIYPNEHERILFVRLLASVSESEWSCDKIIDFARKIKGVARIELLDALSQLNIQKSKCLPTIESVCGIDVQNLSDKNLVDEITQELNDKNILPGSVFGNGQLSQLDDLIVDSVIDFFVKNNELPDNINAGIDKVPASFIPAKALDNIRETTKKLSSLRDICNKEPKPDFKNLIKFIKEVDDEVNNLFLSSYGIMLMTAQGKSIFSAAVTGTGMGILSKTIKTTIDSVIDKGSDDLVKQGKPATATKIKCWLSKFNDNCSIVIFFDDELINKRILPQINKILDGLGAPDSFRQSIIEEVKYINKESNAGASLEDYNKKIKSISDYLNYLIKYKNLPDNNDENFDKLIATLSSPHIDRLNFNQKSSLLKFFNSFADITTRLEFIENILEINKDVSSEKVDNAIFGLDELFKLKIKNDIELDKLLKLSFHHNLNCNNPFPFELINELQSIDDIRTTGQGKIFPKFIEFLQINNVDSDLLKSSMSITVNTIRNGNAEQKDLIISLLGQVSKDSINEDLKCFNKLVETENNALAPEAVKQLCLIFTRLAQANEISQIKKLLDIKNKLIDTPEYLSLVYPLFLTFPYPKEDALLDALYKPLSTDLKEYCHNFDLNPFYTLGEKRPLDEHFATNRVAKSIAAVQDLIDGSDIQRSMQIKLTEQLMCVQMLGGLQEAVNDKCSNSDYIINLPRSVLKKRALDLIHEFRSSAEPIKPSETHDLSFKQLELISLLREIYFRTTSTVKENNKPIGVFLNSTQILSLLLSLHYPDNLLMQIKTGQGKSHITPMLAVLQWANGGTVDVCTANADLLERDYQDSYAPLFKFLDLEHNLIRADSKTYEYKENGINCSTLKEIGLFRMIASQKGEELPQSKTSLLLDEVDSQLLDITSMLCLANNSCSSTTNPLAWVYPLLDEFIEKPEYLNNGSGAWDEEKDIEQLRIFLISRVESDAEKTKNLGKITEQGIKKLLNAACVAKLYEEEQEFLIKTKKETIDGIERVTGKIVIPSFESNGIFADGVQDALLARLQRQNPEDAEMYKINPHFPVLESRSIISVIESYIKTGGNLRGNSATIGDPDELKYLYNQYNIKAIASPSHADENLHENESRYSLSKKELTSSLLKTIHNIEKPFRHNFSLFNPYDDQKDATKRWKQQQPPSILVVTKDLKEAREHAEAIKRRSEEKPTPICFVVDNKEMFNVFKAQCENASDEISKNARNFIKIILKPSNANYYEKIRQEGYLIQQVKGDESSEQIKNRIKQNKYRVQLIEGTEPQEKLKKIIRQAGEPNTITIGSYDKLGRGIDVKNLYGHPHGIHVIPTTLELNKRTEKQVKGRVARNGDIGFVTPHFILTPPNNFFKRILYMISSWYRTRYNKKVYQEFQEKINLNAAVERAYTQQIDNIQHVFMRLFDDWRDLFKTSAKYKKELYDYRSELLTEIRNNITSTVTLENIEEAVKDFEQIICELWEKIKKEKLIPIKEQLKDKTVEQDIGFQYLETLLIKNELSIVNYDLFLEEIKEIRESKQRKDFSIQDNNIKNNYKNSTTQCLNMIVANKSRIMNKYKVSKVMSEDDIKQLHETEVHESLPYIIYELCKEFPDTIKKFDEILSPTGNNGGLRLIDLYNGIKEWITEFPDKFSLSFKSILYWFEKWGIKAKPSDQEEKNTLIKIQEKVRACQNNNELTTYISSALDEKIHTRKTLADRLKMQHVVLAFSSVSPNSNEGVNNQSIEKIYRTQLMRNIAISVCKGLSWVKNEPQSFLRRPFSIQIENEEVILAAHSLYKKALTFISIENKDDDVTSNQEFYTSLQEAQQKLKSSNILSKSKWHPRTIVQDTLDLIDSLSTPPIGCEQIFRIKAHDSVVIKSHITNFELILQNESNKHKGLTEDKHYNYFSIVVNKILSEGRPELSTLFELQACVSRFSSYPEYKHLRQSLINLKYKLDKSVLSLSKKGVLKSNESVFSPEFLRKKHNGVEGDIRMFSNHDHINDRLKAGVKERAFLSRSNQKPYTSAEKTTTLISNKKLGIDDKLNNCLAKLAKIEGLENFINQNIENGISIFNEADVLSLSNEVPLCIEYLAQFDNDGWTESDYTINPPADGTGADFTSAHDEINRLRAESSKKQKDKEAETNEPKQPGLFKATLNNIVSILYRQKAANQEQEPSNNNRSPDYKSGQIKIINNLKDNFHHKIKSHIDEMKLNLKGDYQAVLSHRKIIEKYESQEIKKQSAPIPCFFKPSEFFNFGALVGGEKHSIPSTHETVESTNNDFDMILTGLTK